MVRTIAFVGKYTSSCSKGRHFPPRSFGGSATGVLVWLRNLKEIIVHSSLYGTGGCRRDQRELWRRRGSVSFLLGVHVKDQPILCDTLWWLFTIRQMWKILSNRACVGDRGGTCQNGFLLYLVVICEQGSRCSR